MAAPVLNIIERRKFNNDVELIQGDAKDELIKLPENSVQCFVTSPPYYKCRIYPHSSGLGQEKTPSEYISNLCDIFDRAKISLRENGLLWVIIGDSKAGNPHDDIFCKKGEFIGIPWLFALEMRKRGWRIQQEAIWAKKNPIPTSSMKMLTPSHETIFMFSLSDAYLFDPTAILVDSKTEQGSKMPAIGGSKLGGGTNSSYSGNCPVSTGQARRRDVFFIATSKLPEAHFAPFPADLIEPLIIASTRENDYVGDMFCGSGTTGIVARNVNRKFVGIDYSSEYIVMSERRIQHSINITQSSLENLSSSMMVLKIVQSQK